MSRLPGSCTVAGLSFELFCSEQLFPGTPAVFGLFSPVLPVHLPIVGRLVFKDTINHAKKIVHNHPHGLVVVHTLFFAKSVIELF